MPTHTQVRVEAVVTTAGLGSSSSANASSAFPASPIHSGELTDDVIKSMGQKLLLDGVVNDSGHTYGEFHRDYDQNGAPDISEVKTGGGGLPGHPKVPNPSSPADGFDETTIPDAPDGWGDKEPNTWGSGVGSTLEPSVSSANISAHTLGDYGLGKSVGSGS